MRRTPTLVAAMLILAGCGSKSDEDKVRDTARQLAADGHAHRWGDFCAKTTNPDDCTKTLASLKAIGVDAAEFIPSDDTADRMKITINGDRATIDSSAASDAEYVRRSDHWLFVWKGD
jgi:hypothetical protein